MLYYKMYRLLFGLNLHGVTKKSLCHQNKGNYELKKKGVKFS